MNKNSLILTVAAGVLALGGCNKENGFAEAGGDITIEASVGAMTKVSYDGNKTAFTAGDQIAVYGWTGDATAVPATRVVDGVVNTFDGSKWTPASQMLWKPGTDAHYFLGVYPVHNITSFTADAYTLDPADYTGSDLLIATNLDGVKASDCPVVLTFDHAMAKLVVNLKFRSEFGGTPSVSAVKVSAKSTATVDYLTKAVTATGDASQVGLAAEASASTGYELSYSGLQVPQEGVRKVTVSIGGKEFIYESATDIPLTGGRYTTLCLNVGRDRIDLGSISVSDWTAGAVLPDGDAYIVPPPGTGAPLSVTFSDEGTPIDSFTFSHDVSQKVISVGLNDANLSWSIESDMPWCHILPGEHIGPGSFTIKVDENESFSAREVATLTFVAGEYRGATLSVGQNGSALLIPQSYLISPIWEKDYEINVTTLLNDYFDFDYDEWINVEEINAFTDNNTKTVTLKIWAADNNDNSRFGRVTLTDCKGERHYIYLFQFGREYKYWSENEQDEHKHIYFSSVDNAVLTFLAPEFSIDSFILPEYATSEVEPYNEGFVSVKISLDPYNGDDPKVRESTISIRLANASSTVDNLPKVCQGPVLN